MCERLGWSGELRKREQPVKLRKEGLWSPKEVSVICRQRALEGRIGLTLNLVVHDSQLQVQEQKLCSLNFSTPALSDLLFATPLSFGSCVSLLGLPYQSTTDWMD